MVFEGEMATIKHGQVTIVKVQKEHGMYEIPLNIVTDDVHTNQSTRAYLGASNTSRHKTEPLSMWHRRLGHPGREALIRLLRSKSINYLDDGAINCIACIKGKAITKAIKDNSHLPQTQEVFGRVHMDLIGPLPTSIEGFRYSLVMIDDASRYAWVTHLRHKGETFTAYLRFESMVRTQFDCSIRRIRSDNGGEFVCHPWLEHSRRKGTVREWSAPHSPHQNGVVERFNQTLGNGTRCLLSDSHLPDKFWPEALSYFTYISNRTSKSSLSKYETKGDNHLPTSASILHSNGLNNDVNDIRVFGCDAFALVEGRTLQKLDNRSSEKIFVGFNLDDTGQRSQEAYRLYDPMTKRFSASRNVALIESSFTHGRTETTSTNVSLVQWSSKSNSYLTANEDSGVTTTSTRLETNDVSYNNQAIAVTRQPTNENYSTSHSRSKRLTDQ